MADETSRVARYLFDTLSGDVELMSLVSGVFEVPAPQGCSFPLVCFSLSSAVDTTTGDTLQRIFSHQLWTVMAVVDDVSFSAAVPIVDRVDALLEGSSGEADGAVVYKVSREGSVRTVEEVEGRQYRHLGGEYRILAQLVEN